MKNSVIRNLFLVPVIFLVFSACDMFKIDNYEGPNATLKGGIKDAVTSELVETDIQSGSTLQLKELGWAEGGLLGRVVMQNGEYQDKMMFAGRYRVEFSACNFYPHIIEEIVVEKGENIRDFSVTPYIRVRNVNIRQEGSEIVATFNLQAGNPEVRLSNVRIFLSTDMYVGEPYTSFPLSGAGHTLAYSPAIEIDENETYRLSIDLTHENNKPHFRYVRNYYFRVGAMAAIAPGGTNVGTIRRNYAPYTVINFNVP